jgi:hypothetical protein
MRGDRCASGESGRSKCLHQCLNPFAAGAGIHDYEFGDGIGGSQDSGQRIGRRAHETKPSEGTWLALYSRAAPSL